MPSADELAIGMQFVESENERRRARGKSRRWQYGYGRFDETTKRMAEFYAARRTSPAAAGRAARTLPEPEARLGDAERNRRSCRQRCRPRCDSPLDRAARRQRSASPAVWATAVRSGRRRSRPDRLQPRKASSATWIAAQQARPTPKPDQVVVSSRATRSISSSTAAANVDQRQLHLVARSVKQARRRRRRRRQRPNGTPPADFAGPSSTADGDCTRGRSTPRCCWSRMSLCSWTRIRGLADSLADGLAAELTVGQSHVRTEVIAESCCAASSVDAMNSFG